MTEKQGGSDVRANTTVAVPAERRRPRRRVRDHRPQVVLLGADVRRVPRARPGRGRHLLLPAAALDPRRRAQPLPHPAAQGQARQPLQRLQRGRVPRRLGAAGRRGGPRRRDDHRDGQPHPARLHDRLDLGDAGRHRAGDLARPAPIRLRQAARRPAADGATCSPTSRSSPRRRRSRAPGSPGSSTRPTPATSGRRWSAGSRPRCSSTGPASAPPTHAVEALECFGGNGYVEESGMPRLFRESPLQSIWEGSGNVQALDVLRAMVKSPAATAGVRRRGRRRPPEPSRGSTASPPPWPRTSGDTEQMEMRARRLVERMALALQGSLLVRFGDPAVADAFCATRLDGDWGNAFGTLPARRRHGRDRRAPRRPRLRSSPRHRAETDGDRGVAGRSIDGHVAEVAPQPPREAQRARLRDVRGDQRRDRRGRRRPLGPRGRAARARARASAPASTS